MLNNRVNTVKNFLIHHRYNSILKHVPSGQLSASTAKIPSLFQPSLGTKMSAAPEPSCASFAASILKSKRKSNMSQGARGKFEGTSPKNCVDYSKTLYPEIG